MLLLATFLCTLDHLPFHLRELVPLTGLGLECTDLVVSTSLLEEEVCSECLEALLVVLAFLEGYYVVGEYCKMSDRELAR